MILPTVYSSSASVMLRYAQEQCRRSVFGALSASDRSGIAAEPDPDPDPRATWRFRSSASLGSTTIPSSIRRSSRGRPISWAQHSIRAAGCAETIRTVRMLRRSATRSSTRFSSIFRPRRRGSPPRSRFVHVSRSREGGADRQHACRHLCRRSGDRQARCRSANHPMARRPHPPARPAGPGPGGRGTALQGGEQPHRRARRHLAHRSADQRHEQPARARPRRSRREAGDQRSGEISGEGGRHRRCLANPGLAADRAIAHPAGDADQPGIGIVDALWPPPSQAGGGGDAEARSRQQDRDGGEPPCRFDLQRRLGRARPGRIAAGKPQPGRKTGSGAEPRPCKAPRAPIQCAIDPHHVRGVRHAAARDAGSGRHPEPRCPRDFACAGADRAELAASPDDPGGVDSPLVCCLAF